MIIPIQNHDFSANVFILIKDFLKGSTTFMKIKYILDIVNLRKFYMIVSKLAFLELFLKLGPER